MMNVLDMDKKQAAIFALMSAIILILTGFIVFKELNSNKDSGLMVIDNYSYENHIVNGVTPNNIDDSIAENDDITDQNLEKSPAKIKVYITGQVKNPGVIEVEEGSRLEDVVEKAGGLLEDADLLRVNLAIRVKDEGMYIIPKEGDPVPEAMYDSSNMSQEGSKININTASETELQQLPRIGPALAKGIIEYREKNGPFKKIEEIKNVPRIGDKTFEELKELITVE